jgi:hypothetical protein
MNREPGRGLAACNQITQNHPGNPGNQFSPQSYYQKKLKPSSPRTLSRTAEGISIPWNGGDIIADKKARKNLENAKKIRAKSISTGTDHTFEILGEYSHNQPVCHLRERVGTCQLPTTSHGILCLPRSNFTTMDIPPFQTQVNQPPGQPPTSWNQITSTGANCFPPSPASKRMDKGVPGADSVLPQVIATTVLPALARQAKEVEQRNPRKRSAACQSTKTTAKRATGNQDNKEQIATTSRECNALTSNVIQTACDNDST